MQFKRNSKRNNFYRVKKIFFFFFLFFYFFYLSHDAGIEESDKINKSIQHYQRSLSIEDAMNEDG